MSLLLAVVTGAIVVTDVVLRRMNTDEVETRIGIEILSLEGAGHLYWEVLDELTHTILHQGLAEGLNH